MKKLVVAVALCLVTTGCAGLAFGSRPVSGNMGFYADTRSGELVTENTLGAKSGESCAQSILGIVTTGDASIAEAARKGGITKIATVDNKFTNIVGVIATYCVVVTGQ